MDNNQYNPYENFNYNPGGQGSNGGSNYDPNQDKKPKSFASTLAKTIAIALVFGLVAGAAGTAVMRFGGALDGDATAGVEDDANKNEQKPGNNGGTEESKPSVDVDIPTTDESVNNVITMIDVSDLVENAMPSIVAITNVSEQRVQAGFGQYYTQEVESCGTGFLIDKDDVYMYIATNNHVVEGAKKLTVQFSDGAEVEASIKGQVATKDLAVIKVALADVPKDTLSTIRLASLGDSNSLRIGEGAVAIGNALGYGQSATTGVVSALGRSVKITDSTTGLTIVNNNLIQTNAAINPGNSGGPLFNAKGQVIGINSAKYADTDVEGIGYAIPISDAMLVMEKLIKGEQVDTAKAGYLGIQGLDSSMGVLVVKVFSGSGAEKAGIGAGDIITGFEGNEISTMSQLQELLSYYPAGEEVEFEILQKQGNEYKEVSIKVTLGDANTIK